MKFTGHLFVFLIGCALSLEYESCLTVSCGTGNTTSECISVSASDGKVKVTPCSDNLYCDDKNQLTSTTGQWTSAKCEAIEDSTETNESLIRDSAAGAECTDDSICASNSCKDGFCEGIISGGICTLDDECEIGTFCFEDTTQPSENSTSSNTATNDTSAENNTDTPTENNTDTSNTENATDVTNNTTSDTTSNTTINETASNTTTSNTTTSNTSTSNTTTTNTTTSDTTTTNTTTTDISNSSTGSNSSTSNTSTENTTSNSTTDTSTTNETDTNTTTSRRLQTSTNKICKAVSADGESCSRDAECQVGSACNNLICFKLFSLAIGQAASNSKFCETGLVRNGICDGILVNSDNNTLDSPYKCKIGSNCTYVFESDSSVFTTDRCQCGGISSSSGYCKVISGQIGVWDLINPKLQYKTSNCSGALAHTDNVYDIINCGSWDQDTQDYYNEAIKEINAWTLYQSGAIDSCAEKLGLFTPNSTSIDTSSGEVLMISAILVYFY